MDVNTIFVMHSSLFAPYFNSSIPT